MRYEEAVADLDFINGFLDDVSGILRAMILLREETNKKIRKTSKRLATGVITSYQITQAITKSIIEVGDYKPEQTKAILKRMTTLSEMRLLAQEAIADADRYLINGD